MNEAAGAYVYAPHERPFLPGGPHLPRHSMARRAGYLAVALITGTAASLGNAMLSVNVTTLGGALDLDPAQMSWLPALFVAAAVCANLLLVKARSTFGIPAVTSAVLLGQILATLGQLARPGFAAEAVVQLTGGLCAAGLIALTIYNMLQIFPANRRPVGLVLAFGIPQLANPLARLIPVDLLALHDWRGLTLIELGLALLSLGAMHLVRLPPNQPRPAFERLDGLTLALFASAMVLAAGVVSLGRVVWWTDTPWLGLALAGAVVLFIPALLIERNRPHPLLVIPWIAGGDVIRFALVAVMVRMALAEQNYGSIGLLAAAGLDDDQLHRLFALVLVVMVAGTVVSTGLLAPLRIPLAIAGAALLIAMGAFMDSQASNLTRPEQFYLSQSLIAFGASLFVGPALVFGFSRMLQYGPEAFISYVVLFGLTQNLGALAGPAALGSYQTIRARTHLQALAANLVPGDPQVAARLKSGASALASTLGREANIMGFNDMFRLIGVIATATAVYMAFRALHHLARARSAAASKERS
ncbi:MFS transporter [bacterium]|nr:MFS transporter [bacterium]